MANGAVPVRFSALAHRDFRLFLLGQTISLSGTWMQSVAQGWLVYSLTRSPLYLGVVAAAGALPIMFFTLAGGIIADRFPKKKILLLTQALSILPAVILGVLTMMEAATVWHIAAVAFMLGTINAIDIPTRQSFLIEMVGKGDIVNAIALNSAAFNGSRIIGPVIAGISITHFGMPACFFINALSFIAVIIALSMMKAEGSMRVQSEGIVKDMLQGLHFIKSRTEILHVITLIAVFSLVGIPYINLIPVFAGEIFNAGPKGLGYLVGASGIGALSAALGMAASVSTGDKTRFMSLAALCFSGALILFAVSASFELSLIIIAAAGWGMVSYLAAANSYIQLMVPDELRGRVMSVYSLVFLGVIPVGNAIMGLAADLAGTRQAVLAGGILCLVSSVIFSMKFRLPAKG